MNALRKILPVLVPVAAILGATARLTTSDSERTPVPAQAAHTVAVVRNLPASEQLHLLYARPFSLEQGFVHTWRAEQPLVRSGWLLVIEAPHELLVPKQTMERVLYVGDQTAERVNVGEQSGHVVVVVPSPLGADGMPELDLHQAMIWYGGEELPERVDAARIASEKAEAALAGHAPLAAAEVDAAIAEGGSPLVGEGRRAIDNEAGGLLTVYAPDEVERIHALTLPVVPR